MGRGWGGGEGPERGLEPCVWRRRTGRESGGQRREDYPHKSCCPPPPSQGDCQAPSPAGGPRPAVCGGREGKGGSGRRDPLEGPLLSFRQKKPQIPDPLAWGSESLRAGQNQVHGRAHGSVRKPLHIHPAARCSFRSSPATPTPPESPGCSKATDLSALRSRLGGGQGDLACGLAASPALPVHSWALRLAWWLEAS